KSNSKHSSELIKNSTLKTHNSTTHVVGILPMVHMKHFIFGNSLISIPFFDMAGILTDSIEAEEALLIKAIEIGKQLKVDNIELRQTDYLNSLNTTSDKFLIKNSEFKIQNCAIENRTNKVRMLLKIPNSSEELMKSFRAKLRSQIKKPMKEGLKVQIGDIELLDDFYRVFTSNMRDLGSPVHSKRIIENVINGFYDITKIVIVYNQNEPVACSIVVGFGKILENPWASALRQYSRLSPNMLLYWTMLEYACDNGFEFFDFGRSTPNEGTYKFKEQWGAKPNPIFWQYIYLNEQNRSKEAKDDKSKYSKAIQYWQKLPVSVTIIIGPMIRKHIGL
ncbi:GNAT family N-acetyltransferase, partial [Desulfobacterales bacterium]|nr:GNAT family N-acetyltransferase [Desulfobacterales bacterium]